jgi:hypothetical protein
MHEDKLVARWRTSGTHRGEFMGLAPTGRRAAVEDISIDRWNGDRILETWIAYDTLSILQQIGAAPTPGSAIERTGKRAQRIAIRSQHLRRRGSRWVHERRNRVHASGQLTRCAIIATGVSATHRHARVACPSSAPGLTIGLWRSSHSRARSAGSPSRRRTMISRRPSARPL